MIRLFLLLVFGAVAISGLLHINVWVVFIPLALFAVYAYTAGGQALRCPACRKRIKLGATACGHCGRTVEQARDPKQP